MGALLIALIPVIEALAAGAPIAAVVAGLTVTQWLNIAAAVAGLAYLVETEVPQVIAFLQKLHPDFEALVSNVKQFGPETAAAMACRQSPPDDAAADWPV
jgi:hypothetical protein